MRQKRPPSVVALLCEPSVAETLDPISAAAVRMANDLDAFADDVADKDARSRLRGLAGLWRELSGDLPVIADQS